MLNFRMSSFQFSNAPCFGVSHPWLLKPVIMGGGAECEISVEKKRNPDFWGEGVPRTLSTFSTALAMVD